MSSNTYSAYLTPDPWLRIVVLTSGRLLIAAGLVVILTLPLDVAIRGIVCACWAATGRFELQRLQRGFMSCIEIRVGVGGEVFLLNDHGQWLPGTLLTGSIVLRKFGWLRLQSADGLRFAELVRGDARESQNWRRLQVIWRHIGAGG